MEVFKTNRRCGIENCRSRRYHIGEDGYTYCENSHRQDVSLVVGEDDFRTGVSQAYAETSRIQKEKQETVSPYLDGREGMILYLQCFQLILWKQVSWLIKTKNYPEELQVVARDLWTLRLHMLRQNLEARDERRASQFFSTQSDVENSDVDSGLSSAAQAKLYTRAPQLVESIAICYLSLILLRVPIHSGKFFEWLAYKDFVYLKALQELPHSMKNTLAPRLRMRLDARTGRADLKKLHPTVLSLTMGFRSSFDMEFPAINHHLILFRFMASLSLPLDVFSGTNNLIKLLNFDFKYFAKSHRLAKAGLGQIPEIRLLASLVVVVKILYPFDSDTVTRHPISSDSPAAEVVDWNAWNEARTKAQQAPSGTDSAELEDMRSQTPNIQSQKIPSESSAGMPSGTWLTTKEQDALHMSKQDIDSYLTWFNDTFIDLPKDENGHETGGKWLKSSTPGTAQRIEFRRVLFRMFPTDMNMDSAVHKADSDEMSADSEENHPSDHDSERPPIGPLDSITKAHIARIEAVQKSLQRRRPIPESDDDAERTRRTFTKHDYFYRDGIEPFPSRPGSMYKHYRSLEEVPNCARAFFADAAALVGISVEKFLRALFQVEMVMKRWVDEERKRAYKEEKKGLKKGDTPMQAEQDEDANSDL